MSLGQWVFNNYGVPFIALRHDHTLREARDEVNTKGYKPNHVFLIYHDTKQNIWRAARFHQILNNDNNDPLLLDLHTPELPLARVDEVIPASTKESSDDVVERLLLFAQQVFVVVDDQDKVVGVLTNTELDSTDEVEPVQFTALYPRSVATETETMLLVYVHLESVQDEIIADSQMYANRLGKISDRPRRARLKPELKRGTQLTIVPELETRKQHLINFKQSSITLPWDYDWEVFPFSFTAHTDAASQLLPIHISIQVAGIQIADINVSLEIVKNSESSTQTSSAVTRMHQKIFISYAREDIAIVRRYYQAQVAAANEVFFDVESLRAGDYWRPTVKKALDQADFVQLFWSEHSAVSRNVRFEWEYFLNNRCAGGDCEGRLRPVYWKDPLPSIPDELRRINFRYVSFNEADKEV